MRSVVSLCEWGLDEASRCFPIRCWSEFVQSDSKTSGRNLPQSSRLSFSPYIRSRYNQIRENREMSSGDNRGNKQQGKKVRFNEYEETTERVQPSPIQEPIAHAEDQHDSNDPKTHKAHIAVDIETLPTSPTSCTISTCLLFH